MNPLDIRKILLNAREKREMSASHVARRAGIHRSQMQNAEYFSKGVSWPILKKLLEIYGVDTRFMQYVVNSKVSYYAKQRKWPEIARALDDAGIDIAEALDFAFKQIDAIYAGPDATWEIKSYIYKYGTERKYASIEVG